MLDENRGGRFQINPEGEFRSEQSYAQNTHVLETTFETPHGRAILTDWMPTNEGSEAIIHRRVEVVEGSVSWLMICTPRFSGGLKAEAEVFRNGILFRGPAQNELAHLHADVPLQISANGSAAVARFTLGMGDRCQFTWAWGRTHIAQLSVPRLANPQETIEFWMTQAHRCPSTGCPFAGPWHDLLVRSGLLLKVLQTKYAGSLAEAVAPSFPRHPGERHGWEHRYAWVQNTATGMQAFANLDYHTEATALFQWLSDLLVRDGVEGLQPAYLLDGGKQFSESKPILPDESIRTLHEFHLDTFGQVLLAAFEYRRLIGHLPAGLWQKIVEIADYICQAWRRPDYGPWHPGRSVGGRSRPEHFVVSKLFCWVVLDRAIQLAESANERPTPRWLDERRILHRTIIEQGYDNNQRSFVRSFADRELDPATLLIPILGFLPPDDPRVLGTLDAIQSQLSEGVFIHARRDPHGVEFPGASLLFSFLYVSALAICGRAEEAQTRLAELGSYATSMGFYGDTINLASNENRGSFPSLEVHLALIQAGIHVAAARGRNLILAPASSLALPFPKAKSA